MGISERPLYGRFADAAGVLPAWAWFYLWGVSPLFMNPVNVGDRSGHE